MLEVGSSQTSSYLLAGGWCSGNKFNCYVSDSDDVPMLTNECPGMSIHQSLLPTKVYEHPTRLTHWCALYWSSHVTCELMVQHPPVLSLVQIIMTSGICWKLVVARHQVSFLAGGCCSGNKFNCYVSDSDDVPMFTNECPGVSIHQSLPPTKVYEQTTGLTHWCALY